MGRVTPLRAANPDWLDDWLGYARRLLHDVDHHRVCDQLLGVDAVGRADAADLRWPGYVGSKYEPGGLLLVATVHREFASGRPPLPEAERDRLVQTTRAWRDGQVDDDAWIGVLRDTYRAGLGRHWIVGRLLRALTRTVGVGVDDVAYVNAARCQIVENPPPRNAPEAKQAVLGLCARDYSVADLAGILRPAALIMSKGTFDAAAGLLPVDVPVVVAHQRQLGLCVPFRTPAGMLPEGTSVAVWAPALRQMTSS